MLVITRREGEEVVIGDPRNPIGIVRIASIKGDRVRVAFDFPRTIDVHRREIADQISGDAAAAAALPGSAETTTHADKPAEIIIVAGRDAHANGTRPANATQPGQR